MMNSNESKAFLEQYTRVFPSSNLSKDYDKQGAVAFCLAPHPDDECLMGAPLVRLMRESKTKVFAIALTLGSDPKQHERRKQEFLESCDALDFDPVLLSGSWDDKFQEIKQLIKQHSPNLLVAPHESDQHPTHIKSGQLASRLSRECQVPCLRTEFWSPIKAPNILMEMALDDAHKCLVALQKHKGEIQRNPYHLRYPAWLIDNVRRGSEIVGGKGSTSADFGLGVCLKLDGLTGPKVIPTSESFWCFLKEHLLPENPK